MRIYLSPRIQWLEMRFSTTRSSASYGGVLTNYTPFSWIKSYKCGYYYSPLHRYVDAGVGLLLSSRFLPSCKRPRRPELFREPDQTLRVTPRPGGDCAFGFTHNTLYHSYISVFAVLTTVVDLVGIEPT